MEDRQYIWELTKKMNARTKNTEVPIHEMLSEIAEGISYFKLFEHHI